MNLNKTQTATVLAALRYWQREGWRSSGHEVEKIATDGGNLVPLDEKEIDELCEQITFDDDPVRNLLEGAVQEWAAIMDDDERDIPGTDAVDWLTQFIDEARKALGDK